MDWWRSKRAACQSDIAIAYHELEGLASTATMGDLLLMSRTLATTSILLFIASGALAQSDEEILETIRASATALYLEQLPKDLPESFLNSGLPPSDIERLVRQMVWI